VDDGTFIAVSYGDLDTFGVSACAVRE